MTVILTDAGEFEVDARDGLWLTAADAERATGWTLKPEGMCRDEACVPLPASARRDGRVDVEAFWRKLGGPVVADETGAAWSLQAAPQDSDAALAGLVAPDFTLPDLDGKPHTLSALRGRKVFLSTWASW